MFANPQATLISVLSNAVTKFIPYFPILEDVLFTVKREPENIGNMLTKEAVLTPTGSAFTENGTGKEIGFNCNIYAASFDELIELGSALETVINSIKGGGVRYCAVEMGAIQVPEDDETNFHSLLTFVAVFGGKSLPL
jgi:hypothetical protein